MLEIKDISVKLGDFKLQNINLEVDKGDYYVLLGKSGVGKTVLLEIIAGLISPDSGQVILNHKDITHEKIQKREVGIVFQDYAVFPHLTVKQNIEYPLKHKHIKAKERRLLVHEFAELTNITHLLQRGTQNLSGGELQRVALARMLVNKPQCLLLDEPLASLDIQLKGDLRNLLRKINQTGTTLIHVTHDYEEAIALSNKVAVMQEGRIIQKGNTKEVFQKPANKFVAHFTGIKNFFPAVFSSNKATIDPAVIITVVNPDQLKKGKVIICGEEIILSRERIESSAVNNFPGTIKQIIPYLTSYEIVVDIGIELSVIISEESLQKFQFKENTSVWVSFKSTAIKIIP
ncbi:MAG: ABC transporter ATP-binding protein [Bacteroidales bacterium]|jgi:ABC-type Fe3+/spermidine/putrescine transport system ATPase subunit|nr:ABC transporter ATP-binding protein [Bacteroidales bacterium]